MTAQEIENRIRLLQSRIEGIQDENYKLNTDIHDLEAGIDDASSMSRQWENKLSECYGVVSRKLENLSHHSTFRAAYLERIEMILSSREAVEISECLTSMQTNAVKKISDIEEDIRANQVRILNYEQEIDNLRRELTTMMEMSPG